MSNIDYLIFYLPILLIPLITLILILIDYWYTFIYKVKNKKCKHKFKRISNCWFHWNYGFSVCIGKCVRCGLKRQVKTIDTINLSFNFK